MTTLAFRIPQVLGVGFLVAAVLIFLNIQLGTAKSTHTYFDDMYGTVVDGKKVDGWQRFSLWFAFAAVILFTICYLMAHGKLSDMMGDVKKAFTNGFVTILVAIIVMSLSFFFFYKGLPAKGDGKGNLVHEKNMGVGIGLMMFAAAVIMAPVFLKNRTLANISMPSVPQLPPGMQKAYFEKKMKAKRKMGMQKMENVAKYKAAEAAAKAATAAKKLTSNAISEALAV